MLNQLSIKNVAVIDKLDVSIHSGLSVLTGETGAGKSIIIDSINMILGDRASKELVRYGTEKAFVQAVFDANEKAAALLEENDIDDEDGQIIISRTITKDGKSSARINGTVVTLSLLRDIADCLINIHGQHDNQALLTPSRHLDFLDGFGKTQPLLNEYKSLYRQMRSAESELKALETNEREKMQRIDLLEYQIKEITDAALTENEEEELLKQREMCENAEKISNSIDMAYAALYDNGEIPSAYDSLSVAVNALSDICDLNETLKGAYESINNAVYAIEDSSHELLSFRETINFDEQTLDEVEERLNLISKLKRKYGRTIADIIAFGEQAQSELDGIMMSGERAEELREQLKRINDRLAEAGKRLSDARTAAAKVLESKIETALHELNMEKSKFSVRTEREEKFTEHGIDKVEFMISTNPGEPLKALVKIASGGELSRVMLAIKSILAETDSVETMIFDEIDTGVSGNTALKIADKLTEIGKTRQVICITHLPQLTAAAQHHYLISKNTDGEMAVTTLTELDDSGRAEELARIIDGGEVTETALNHAKELLSRR